jgi:hypothetical protein
MRRLLRYSLICMGLTLCAVAIVFWWVGYRSYFRYQSGLDAVVRAIPAEERNLPASFQTAVQLVHPKGVRQAVIQRVFRAVRPGPPRTYAYTGNMAVWSLWFPVLHSDREVLAYYAHTMVFEGGEGLSAAARYYFGKPPSGLTDDEALSLVVMDLSPKYYSMRLHPDRFRDAMRRYGPDRPRMR